MIQLVKAVAVWTGCTLAGKALGSWMGHRYWGVKQERLPR